MMVMSGIGSLLSSAGGAVGSLVSSPAALTLGSLLQGTATVMGVMSALDAGKAQAAQATMQAKDTEAELPQLNLQGIESRRKLKNALVQAQGASDNAYAAGGLDLSFGSAAQARQDAYGEADLAQTTDNGNELLSGSRLQERAANYRIAAKRARRSGQMDALLGGISGAGSILMRGGPKAGRT